jgi:FixJ family two-component response regulator
MSAAASPTVFIVDDDPGVRASIQGLLKTVGLRSEAFASPQEFLSRPRFDGPSCMVLDVRLPDLSGLDFQRKLAESGVQMPVIFITGYADVPMSVKAMKMGAVEFLTKPFRDQDLLDAIQQALERDRVARENRRGVADLQKRYDTLTPREREVMRLVISGMLNKQIAGELSTSEVTVKVHRGQVMRKMEAGSLAELIGIAQKLGLQPGK